MDMCIKIPFLKICTFAYAQNILFFSAAPSGLLL